MRRSTVLGLALALVMACVTTTHAVVKLTQPSSAGAQLIYYYDAREGFTTFVNVRSVGLQSYTIQVDFYGPTFETKVTLIFPLAPDAVRVIDVGALKVTNSLAAQQGIAVATVLNEFMNPIEFPALTGNFTVANLATGSAWGASAAARGGRNISDGSSPPLNTIIDGSTVIYQAFQPTALILASYYDPQSLAPVADRGNQVIFVNFRNAVGVGSSMTSASTTWRVAASRGDGTEIVDTQIRVDGVTEVDLVSLIGEAANGSAGTIFFSVIGGNTTALSDSRLVFFAQALGTFGTGYLLPSLESQ